MDYRELKSELVKLYNEFDRQDIGEIDEFLKLLLDKSLFEIRSYVFSQKEFKNIKQIILKHLKYNVPFQKLLNKAYFFKREFYVNNFVLTPRFDSEVLIEFVLQKDFNSVLDLCCGSGVLGITLKKEKEEIIVDFADISKKALNVAKINAKKHEIKTRFIKTDMFKNIKDKYDLIICNPPYIETKVLYTLDDEVKKFDPILALDGGEDGLKFYNIIFNEIENYLNQNGKCILEIGYNQGHLLEKFEEKFKNVKLIKDYNNLNRAIYFERR